MPSTMNGIGTWYYGKKNINIDYINCESCGKEGVFRSYDTTLYFVLLFIPVIPLKKVRVLYECPACKRHRVISLKEWRKYKEQDLREAIGKLNEFPGDEEKAEEAIGAAASYQDYDAFLPVAEIAGKNFAENAKILCRLGCAFLSLHKFEQAEHYLKKSLEQKEDTDIREILADVLIKQGKTDEAAGYLEHIARLEIPDRIGCLVQLAKAYQCQGEHGKALTALEQCVLILPSVAEIKEFKKLKKLSEKNLNNFKKIRNHAIPSASGKPGGAERDVTGLLAKLPGPLLLLAILIVYLSCCIYRTNHGEMYLVNGLDRAYRFTLNGKEYTLPPFGQQQVPKPAGELTLESADLNLKPETGDLSVNFFLAPFSDPALILNPDGCAVFVRTKTYYAARKEQASPPDHQLSAGRKWYRFSGLDYVFQEFPDSVRAKKDSVTVKEGLFAVTRFLHDSTTPGYWAILEEKLGREDAVKLAERMVACAPDSLFPLAYLQKNLPPEELVRFMRPLLNTVPVPINLHRYYQENMQSVGKLPELEREYEQLTAANSGNSVYKYLHARVTQDPKKKIKLLAEGAALPDPSPYCFHGLAYQAIRVADFEKACEYSGKAITLDPKNYLFQTMHQEARFAAGRYDELLKETRRKLDREKFDLQALLHEMQILAAQGKAEEVESQMKARFEAINRELSPQAVGQYRKFEESSRLARLYCCGQLSEFRKAAEQSGDPVARFQSAITGKDLPEAEKAFAALEKPALNDALLMYTLAKIGEAPEPAARYQVMAAKLLRESGEPEQLRLAAFFDGSARPEFSDILENDISRNKKELAVALGLAHPAIGKPCFELAEKLNYDLNFPHHFLREIVGGRNRP